MEQRSRIHAGLLAVIVLAALGYQAGILAADDAPLIYDPLELSRTSLLLGRGLSLQNGALIEAFFTSSSQSAFPPLIHYAALPITLVFNDSLGSPVASFAFFSLLLILSTYAAGKRVAGPKVGLLAAALVMLTPGLDGFSRVYMVDYPLAAMSAAAIALLFATEGLCRKRHSIVLGLFLGLGFLTKQSFPLYILPPLLVYIVPSLRRGNPGDATQRTRVFNLGLALALGVAIGLTWLGPRFHAFLIDRRAINEFYRQVEPRSFNAFDYLELLAGAAGPILFAAAVLGMIVSKKCRRCLALVAGVLVPLLILPKVFPMLTPRYLLPLLPLMAMLAALAVERIAGRHFRVVALALVALSMAHLGLHSWAKPAGPLNDEEQHARFQEWGVPRPQFTSDEASQLARIIGEHSRGGRVILLLDSPLAEAIQGALWERDLLFPVENFFEMAGIGKLPPGLVTPDEIMAHLRAGEMILVPESGGGPSSHLLPKGVPEYYAMRVFDGLKELRGEFGRISRVEVPGSDGLILNLLIRLQEPGGGV